MCVGFFRGPPLMASCFQKQNSKKHRDAQKGTSRLSGPDLPHLSAHDEIPTHRHVSFRYRTSLTPQPDCIFIALLCREF